MTIKPEAYDLFKAMRHMSNARLYLNSIIKDGHVKGQSKNLLNTMDNRLRCNIDDFRHKVSGEKLKILDEEMLNTEVTLQLDNMTDMLISLPKDIRDEIENHIEGVFNVYSLNK